MTVQEISEVLGVKPTRWPGFHRWSADNWVVELWGSWPGDGSCICMANLGMDQAIIDNVDDLKAWIQEVR